MAFCQKLIKLLKAQLFNFRCCFVKFNDPNSVSVAQHLTNTVFIDRAIIVTPLLNGDIPDEREGLTMATQVLLLTLRYWRWYYVLTFKAWMLLRYLKIQIIIYCLVHSSIKYLQVFCNTCLAGTETNSWNDKAQF